MRNAISLTVAASAALILSACATGPQGAEVTRFHLGQPIARSTVMLVPADNSQAFSLEYRAYADAVAHELAAQNFVPVAGDPTSAYVGTISIRQDLRPGPRRGGFSIGIGGGSFGSGGGVGGGVSVPVSGGRRSDLRTTTLSLQLKLRSNASVVWEGHATMAAQGPQGDLPRAVPVLARALLDGFPGAAGQTVRVKVR